MKKKIIALVLSLSLVLPSLLVPASAVAALPSGVVASPGTILTNSSFGLATQNMISTAIQYLAPTPEQYIRDIFDILVSIVGYGEMSYDKLKAKVDFLNQIGRDPHAYSKLIFDEGVNRGMWDPVETNIEVVDIVAYFTAWGHEVIEWKLVQDNYGNWIISNATETYFFADSLGRYPYCSAITDIWLGSRTALDAPTVSMATDYSLNNLKNTHAALYPDWSFRRTNVTLMGLKYTVLQAASDGVHYDQILCNSNGFPYGIPLYNTQLGDERDYNNSVADQPLVDEEPTVDIDANLIYQMFPDGTFTWVDNVEFTYNEDNRSYNIDASTSYDIDNNYYYNYEWNYTYYIDYTSITYIGQTAEYDEKFEYYYTLPDGRSSADLTLEELEVLNTSIDVLPYIRSADDTSIRALYHFDGDTLDSSYWSHIGHFDWQKGASITYMDAGAFNGALYLDENEHQFSVTLPSNIGSSDFTLQFRYYQSATLTPVSDSTISFGGVQLASLNGNVITVNAVETLYSKGNWQEICFMRKDGVLYFFLNGVPVNNYALTNVLGDAISFSFGDDQQTFKYFDELRVVNSAVYSTIGFTVSSVPFDTNLSLVLPDSQLPVADEYWLFNDDGNLLETSNYLGLGNLDSVAYPLLNAQYVTSATFGDNLRLYGGKWVYRALNSNLSLSASSSGLSFNNSGSVYNPSFTFDELTSFPGNALNGSPYAFVMPLGACAWLNHYPSLVELFDGTLVDQSNTLFSFSILESNGDLTSVEFDMNQFPTGYPRPDPSDYIVSADTPTGGRLTVAFNKSAVEFRSANSNLAYEAFIYCAVFSPPANGSSEIVYCELKQGEPNTGHEFVSSVVVMDKDELNTPSLAVRTDVNITGYQIGGVRPSLPSKGLVWAMVENGRISSLQIYNGQAWVECDGRIWTGSRWVPYYAYDILLLKDLYDVVGVDPTLNPIYSETGFWTWLQSAWKDMISRLDKLISLGGGGETLPPDSDTVFPGVDAEPENGEDGWQIIDLITVLKDATWGVAKGVTQGVFGGLSYLADKTDDIGQFFDFYSGEYFEVSFDGSSS